MHILNETQPREEEPLKINPYISTTLSPQEKERTPSQTASKMPSPLEGLSRKRILALTDAVSSAVHKSFDSENMNEHEIDLRSIRSAVRELQMALYDPREAIFAQTHYLIRSSAVRALLHCHRGRVGRRGPAVHAREPRAWPLRRASHAGVGRGPAPRPTAAARGRGGHAGSPVASAGNHAALNAQVRTAATVRSRSPGARTGRRSATARPRRPGARPARTSTRS